MHRAFEALEEDPFDVLVVGGGIHGAWAARSAARRGMDVALAEAVDFASGTSSRSTMLAHGGLRYLAQYDVGLVREALVERGALTRMAGHLVRPVPFLLPFYEEAPYPAWQLKLGLRLYTLLARGSGYPRHRFLTKRQVLEREPGLSEEGLTGGAVYYDGQILAPERLTTIVARDAAQHGARPVTRAKVTDLAPDGDDVVAGVRDEATGDEVNVRARGVANATGPFLDETLEEAGLPDGRVRLTKGVHLVTPPFTEHAVVVNARDGRTFFAVPWHGNQLVGTTDTDYADDPREVRATREDVSYLQDSITRYFPDAPVDEVRFTYAGLRNLVNESGKPPGEVTRGARLIDHADEDLPTVVSLVGGKLTTARATARELVDEIAVHIGGVREPEEAAPLPGGDVDLDRAYAQLRELVRRRGLDDDLARRIVRLFGAEWPRVAGAGLEPLDEEAGLLEGEAVFAAEQEAAFGVDDVMRRRTLAWASQRQAVDAADAVAGILEHAGVPRDQAEESATAYRQMLAQNDRWRGE